MKKVLFLATLLTFIIAGVGSAVLVAIDWNSVVSDESFAGLGILLFLIGAGIGAILVLLIAFITSRLNKRKTPPQTETKDQPNTESYNIQVNYVKEVPQSTGIKQSDSNLLKKLGYNFTNVFRKLHVKVYSARVETEVSGVFTPTQKSWEKGAHPLESVSTATPRIFVLPPDPPMDVGMTELVKATRSKPRTEISSAGKITKMPDVAILDIKPTDSNEASYTDSNASSTFQSQSSDINSVHSEDSEIESSVQETGSLSTASVSMIDTNLGDYIRALTHQNNEASKPMTYMLSIMVEEVLPRPDSGLLKRMLRMSEIPVGMVEGSGEPILYLRTGSECHISISLIELNNTSSQSKNLTGPHSITLKPVDGEELLLDVNFEKVDNIEQVGSAFWDLKDHASESLAEASETSSTSTILTPIEMKLGFKVEQEGQGMKTMFVKKTIMSCMRSDLTTVQEQERLVHEDSVIEFVLSKMELISMPSLLMFLHLNDDNKDQV